MTGINKFPDELVSNETKKSFAFAKQYASAIWADWESPYISNKTKYERQRQYALGTQSIDICKKKMKRKFIKEEHYLIDWNNRLKIMPQLLRNFYNSVDMTEFSPIIRAIDPNAMEIRNKRKEDKTKLFHAKDFINQMAEMSGGESLINPADVPQSKEQIELEEQTAKPLRVERGEEKAIEYVCLENNWASIQKRALKDAVEINRMVVRIYTDPLEGIKMKYIDPAKFICKDSTDPYHLDAPFFAEVEEITLAQFRRISTASGLSFTDEEIRKIARVPFNQKINESATIRVLNYSFKTFFETVYKKKINKDKNTISLIDRTDDVGTPKEYNPKYSSDKSEKILDNYDVWFEGIMCVDHENLIIKHELVKNLAEYKGKILPPYIVGTLREMSFVEENIDLIDSIQELRYRIIHHRNTLKGILTEIDPDIIANLSFGDEKISPKEVLSLYFTQYISFKKQRDEDGDPTNPVRGITEIPTGIPQSLYALTEQFVSEVQMLFQAFGIYQHEQQNPNPKTINPFEGYKLSQNSAMRDYVDHLFTWSLMSLQVVSSRINDAFKWSHIKKQFIDNIGLEDVEALEQYRNDRQDHYYSLFLDYVPTDQEKALMLQNVNEYVKQGLLDPYDAFEISTIRNIRTALAFMRLRLKEKQDQMQEFELQKIREQQNSQVLSTQVANEEKRKNDELLYQLRGQEKALEFEREAFLLQKTGEIKIQEAAMRENNKQALEDFRAKFTADTTAFKARENAKLRNQIQDKSAKNQEQLIKLRKGEISSISQDDAVEQEEMDLTN